MFPVTCSTDEKITVISTPRSGEAGQGRPAQIQGPLRVSVTAGDGTFEQDPAKPLEFKAVSPDAPGETTYLLQGDADMGEGEVLIQETVVLTTTSATARSFGLSAGLVEPK